MNKARFSHRFLVPLAFTAVISLAAGHLTDLGVQVLGPGTASTPALIGDLTGLAACALSAWFGVRRLAHSSAAC
jgi:hypothetical protein